MHIERPRATTALLGVDQAADYFGVTRRTLARWRKAGTGPAFCALAPRTVRYRVADLDAYAAQTRANPTEE